ncbi:hypothetical protein [Shewanella marina]|uniref:hypothetical protein n=1 Tax=Shewanella marina TaxID=487319 RepID=UPI000470E8E3|nr:hypothetical protein [Shewanella marina]
MLLVSHYPQQPLTTTNVATDAARLDNQQRPPIIPPKEPTKAHEERQFNAQHERTEQSLQQKQVNEKQQQAGQQQQQQRQHAQKQGQQTCPLPFKPVLSRQDLSLAAKSRQKSISILPSTNELTNRELSERYQKISANLNQFYQTKVSPRPAAKLTAYA